MQDSVDEAGFEKLIDRLFRKFSCHFESPDEDTLVDFLSALYSLRERAPSAIKAKIEQLPEFRVMWKLRNIAIHEQEVQYVFCSNVAPGGLLPIQTVNACLVSLKTCLAAGLKPKQLRKVAPVYAQKVVDINPCMLNCMSKIHSLLATLGLKGTGVAYAAYLRDCAHLSDLSAPQLVCIDSALTGDSAKLHEKWILSQFSEFTVEAPTPFTQNLTASGN